jgi:hypothetical protein
MGLFPSYGQLIAQGRAETRKEVMSLVEAMIQGSVDLSPEEMVDAAFLMVERINDRIYGKEK